jgi:hypothetical protein
MMSQMKVIDFLSQLKDASLDSELEFLIPTHCDCYGAGQRCYCSNKPEPAQVEVVCFQKDADAAKVIKAVVHLC